MADKKILTQEGLQKLQDELNDLKIRGLKEIAEKIKEAREQGDLSENAEYDAAKEEQGHIKARIDELEALLKNVEVMDESLLDFSRVNLGTSFTLKNNRTGMEMNFDMVGSTEASSLANKISNESPLGRALLGKKAGESAVFEAPMGEMSFTVIEVHKTV